MTTGTGDRDFNDMLNQAWPGKIFPELFNNTQDVGDGFPGLQGAIRNWTKDYLHSGSMESGLYVNGNDISGVINLHIDNIYSYSSSTLSGNIFLTGNMEFSGNILLSGGDFTGDLNYISGFESVSAITGQFTYLDGTYITGEMTGAMQLTENLDLNTQNIINVVDPVNDQDGATKKYAQHGVASDNLVFSNDVENFVEAPIYTKIKEIIAYRSGNLRVYWEAKGEGGVTLSKTRVYINGVATGSEHTNSTTSYVAFTEDIEINAGDLIQIYGICIVGGPPGDCYVRYQRIKYIEFVSNDP